MDYLVDRTVFELETLLETLDLTDGDPAFLQLGGPYSEVKKQTAGQGYEAHHIPPQSVFDESIRQHLPTIAITKEDHGRTSSYRGRMRAKARSFLPDVDAPKRHKERLIENLERGFLAEMVRNEVYEFKDAFGTRYNGGLKQLIQAMIDYIKSVGIPKNM